MKNKVRYELYNDRVLMFDSNAKTHRLEMDGNLLGYWSEYNVMVVRGPFGSVVKAICNNLLSIPGLQYNQIIDIMKHVDNVFDINERIKVK